MQKFSLYNWACSSMSQCQSNAIFKEDFFIVNSEQKLQTSIIYMLYCPIPHHISILCSKFHSIVTQYVSTASVLIDWHSTGGFPLKIYLWGSHLVMGGPRFEKHLLQKCSKNKFKMDKQVYLIFYPHTFQTRFQCDRFAAVIHPLNAL